MKVGFLYIFNPKVPLTPNVFFPYLKNMLVLLSFKYISDDLLTKWLYMNGT